MAGRSKSGIPFSAKDPRYHKVWELVNRKGKTLEEALVIVGGSEQKVKEQVKNEHHDNSEDTGHRTDNSDSGIKNGASAECSVPTLALVDIGKKLDRMNTHLAEIVRALNRIAAGTAPKPGMEVVVDTSATFPPERKIPPSVRQSMNGLAVGDRVKRVSTEETGEVTRILPGKKEVEVRFMMGTKTLLCDQLQPVGATG